MEKAIKAAVEKCSKMRKECIGDQDIDDKLVKWLVERRDAGVQVTGKFLRTNALQLHLMDGTNHLKDDTG